MVCPYGPCLNPEARRRMPAGIPKGIQFAHWEGMRDVRRLAQNVQVKTELKWKAPRLGRRKDKKGRVAESIGGGPFIPVLPGSYYLSKKGKEIPLKKASIFTWTTKMSCPSFSLPAGPGKYLGVCEAANEASLRMLRPEQGGWDQFHEPLEGRPEAALYICDTCYAGKNLYRTFRSAAIAQRIRAKWVQQAVEGGTFVSEMHKALVSLRDVEPVLAAKKVSTRFFRIHDSGDFVSPRYYMAWVKLAEKLPGIYFWAPTRLWVYSKWRRVFRDYPPPPNLALRPSALFLGAAPPEVSGLAPGSTSSIGKVMGGTWDCPAMEGDDTHSCANAIGPEGHSPCRACWATSVPVSYLLH